VKKEIEVTPLNGNFDAQDRKKPSPSGKDEVILGSSTEIWQRESGYFAEGGEAQVTIREINSVCENTESIRGESWGVRIGLNSGGEVSKSVLSYEKSEGFSAVRGLGSGCLVWEIRLGAMRQWNAPLGEVNGRVLRFHERKE